VFLRTGMAIYTKTGDGGTTGLYGGDRVSKGDVRVEAYGSLDELTSSLGILLAAMPKGSDHDLVSAIQRDLYELMGHLAGAKTNLSVHEKRITQFEEVIDELDTSLPPLRSFILPQGTEASCRAHLARTVCRRAERACVRYLEDANTRNPILLRYLNRLSDLLFVLARALNGGRDIFPKTT